MSALIRDLRLALRVVLRRPALTSIAVLSLAVGLASAASVTSFLDAIGFRPAAVADGDSLVEIRTRFPTGATNRMSYTEYVAMRERTDVFRAVTFYAIRGAGLSGPEGPPEVVMLNIAPADYFSTLGVSPRLGRGLGPTEDASGAPAIVVSYRLWQRRFAGDRQLIQQTIVLNGVGCDVVGVMPPDFTGLFPLVATDVWITERGWEAIVPGGSIARAARDDRSLNVVARLRSGPTHLDALRSRLGFRPPSVRFAQGAVDMTMSGLAREFAATNRDVGATVVPLWTARAGNLVPFALLLWLIVAVVLLVGCANVAGLLMGAGEARRQEMAIRAALGASRARLVMQLVAESLVLAAMGAVAGVALAFWVIRALPGLIPPMGIPLGFRFVADTRVLLVTGIAAMMAILAFGVWPALRAARAGIAQDARSDLVTSGSRRWSVRDALVVGQVGVSIVLLVGGVVLVRSLAALGSIDTGFERRPLLLVTLSPATVGYDGPRSRTFLSELVQRIGASPGIEDASLARRIPLAPNGGGAQRNVVIRASDAPVTVKWNAVLPNYFSIMGTRLTAGRTFGEAETRGRPGVAVINQSMARRFWPGASALGERLTMDGPGGGPFEVVGIVEDGKINRLTETPEPYMFLSLLQVPSSEVTLIVRAGADPARAASVVRDVLRQLDPRMPTMEMLTLAEHLHYASFETRLSAIVVSSLGAAGVLLSLIGLYAVVSFDVVRRRKELGIRLALGATTSDIRRAVLGRALGLAFAGIVPGLCLAYAGVRALGASLYGISAADMVPYAFAAAAVALLALIASWRPAIQATRVDPVNTLRSI